MIGSASQAALSGRSERVMTCSGVKDETITRYDQPPLDLVERTATWVVGRTKG